MRQHRCHDGRVDEDVIPILRVGQAEAAVKWYELLGFTVQWEHRAEPGSPAFVEIARGDVRLFLSEHDHDAQPGTAIYLRVHVVDAVAAECGVTARNRRWTRGVELRDPDGNRVRVGMPID